MATLKCKADQKADSYKETAIESKRSVLEGKIFALEIKAANKGDTVKFGRYEQGNGIAPIEWLVLDAGEDAGLIISKYGLDAIPYNKKCVDTTWEKCTLRAWLNETFFRKAFSPEEQKLIAMTEVTADKNPKYSTPPGNSTTDKLFLLSIPEAERYFDSDEARKCAPTGYAKANGADVNDNYKTADGKPACWWWLRSPGSESYLAASVLLDGSVFTLGLNVISGGICVRPALWIDLANH